ncbi:MAG TPA: hypothetical protein DCX32_00695 [Candidatus Moranbacteria bacterium]|nr:MAG: hypothetical protein UW87_C0006G0014 [Candidatus Moranbacteria bacterium GW2011_GWC2_45_10]KKT95538.1 MAG: hypothetical protein UW95_C0001G0102 [Parcubacteria group bacterium GW2011_GWC1_45_14]HAV11055.1 hypothetical protein [Candidatus Moranbacteria bacterium]
MTIYLILLITVTAYYLRVLIKISLIYTEEQKYDWLTIFLHQAVWTLFYSLVVTIIYHILMEKPLELVRIIPFFILTLLFSLLFTRIVSMIITKKNSSHKKQRRKSMRECESKCGCGNEICDCPGLEKISLFTHGKLSNKETIAIAVHMETCSYCKSVHEKLTIKTLQ